MPSKKSIHNDASKPSGSLKTEIVNRKDDPLIKTNPDIFENLPQEKDNAVLTAVRRTFMKIHSGPLPDPQTLADYNKIIPNAAERIFSEFEQQGNHRRFLEKEVILEQLKQSNRGQNYAFVVCVLFLISSSVAIFNGHDWAGGIVGVGSLTGLVTVFIKGKEYQKRNLQDKKESLPKIK